jgi:hypothetical protein
MPPWFHRVLQNPLPARKTECDVLSQYSVFPQVSCCQQALAGRPGVNVSVFPSGWYGYSEVGMAGHRSFVPDYYNGLPRIADY